MAPQNASSGKAFSIANFKKAFRDSAARQYMSEMEVEQVRTAVEGKDVMLLGKLYDVLLQEQVSDEQIVREFVMTKNRILDDFMAEATSIEKKMVQAPFKKRVAKTEKQEKKRAENILKKL